MLAAARLPAIGKTTLYRKLKEYRCILLRLEKFSCLGEELTWSISWSVQILTLFLRQIFGQEIH